jgi:hypothetical protein
MKVHGDAKKGKLDAAIEAGGERRLENRKMKWRPSVLFAHISTIGAEEQMNTLPGITGIFAPIRKTLDCPSPGVSW